MDEKGVPTWRYRMKDGEIESRIFDSLQIPAGWVDSPAKCKDEPKRRRKVNNGDGA